MNFYDALKKRLTDNGMFDSQAEKVMQIAMKDEAFSNMNQRWSSTVDGYPANFVDLLNLLLRPIAYKWLCENAAKAWFLPVFAPGALDQETTEDIEKFVKNFQAQQYGESNTQTPA